MPLPRVSITNLQATLLCDADRIRRAVRAALREAANRSVQITVAIVDDATIHDLNQRHLQHDYPTDVLSYPLVDSRDRLVGEIVVSAETAQRQAPEYGWSAEEELCLYVIHGALHLAGFRDKTPSQTREMRAAEKRILAELGMGTESKGVRNAQVDPGRRDSRSHNRPQKKAMPAKGRRGAPDAVQAGRKTR
jgi:probable rRNA maturation factor